MGRRSLFGKPMSACERQRRHRAQQAQPPFNPFPVTIDDLRALVVTADDLKRMVPTEADLKRMVPTEADLKRWFGDAEDR
jgi:hypothetical protein